MSPFIKYGIGLAVLYFAYVQYKHFQYWKNYAAGQAVSTGKGTAISAIP